MPSAPASLGLLLTWGKETPGACVQEHDKPPCCHMPHTHQERGQRWEDCYSHCTGTGTKAQHYANQNLLPLLEILKPQV